MVVAPIKIVFLPMVYDWIESRAERRALRDAETDETEEPLDLE